MVNFESLLSMMEPYGRKHTLYGVTNESMHSSIRKIIGGNWKFRLIMLQEKLEMARPIENNARMD
jgi:hypothetical protein